MDNLDIMKILKIVGAVVVGVVAVKVILAVLSVTLNLLIQVLLAGALVVGVLYGVKMLKEK